MADCIFCKIANKEAPAHIIWEDDKHVAFLSIFPNTPGFTVVASKEHLPSYAFENDDQTLKEIIIATKKVAKLLDTAFEDVERTGMFFEGFGVDHLHSKLFPMHGTADMESWEPIESPRNEFYETYPGYLSSHDSKQMGNKRLEKIAEKIKEVNK